MTSSQEGRRIRFRGALLTPEQLFKRRAAQWARNDELVEQQILLGRQPEEEAKKMVLGTPGERKREQRERAKLDNELRKVLQSRGTPKEDIERLIRYPRLRKRIRRGDETLPFRLVRGAIFRKLDELVKKLS